MPLFRRSRRNGNSFFPTANAFSGAFFPETPESIYLDHDTLGVLTIPRAQIAQRPVEIILVNGDRIVGGYHLAETSDSLFVRHASLGITSPFRAISAAPGWSRRS